MFARSTDIYQLEELERTELAYTQKFAEFGVIRRKTGIKIRPPPAPVAYLKYSSMVMGEGAQKVGRKVPED